jgi:hypothetical protein
MRAQVPTEIGCFLFQLTRAAVMARQRNNNGTAAKPGSWELGTGKRRSSELGGETSRLKE